MKLKKLFALLVSCIFIILLFARVPLVISPRLIYTLWPIGHIVSFAFWGWLLISFNAHIKSSGSKRQLVILSLITLIIGGGIELLQPFFSRSAQLSDLYYNLLGTLTAYLFFGNFRDTKKRLYASRVLYLILFVYLIFPALQTLKDEYDTRMDFPIIAKFDSTSELTRWKADLPLSIVNSSELPQSQVADTNLMKITFAAKKESRAVLRFFAGNWQGYEQLKFSFFNPSQKSLKIMLIITDQRYDKSLSNYHDRFETWLFIEPGWHEYDAVLNDIKKALSEREMDLSKMAGVDFYMYELSEPVTLYLHQLELI